MYQVNVRWTVFSPWESPSDLRCAPEGCRSNSRIEFCNLPDTHPGIWIFVYAEGNACGTISCWIFEPHNQICHSERTNVSRGSYAFRCCHANISCEDPSARWRSLRMTGETDCHSPTGFAMTVAAGGLLHIRFIVRYRWCVGLGFAPPYNISFKGKQNTNESPGA